MVPHGRRHDPRPFLLVVAALLLALSAFPHVASCSTPPLQPHLALTVTNTTVLPGGVLAISVVWDRDNSPYLPPEAVRLTLYSVSEQKLIGTYRLPANESGVSGDSVRHFSGAISASELPGGELILTALDPISGAEQRVSVSLEETGADYNGLQNRDFVETVFIGVALLLAIVLIVAVAVLVRRG